MTTGAFIHRATVQRNTESGTDTYGSPLAAIWAAHITLNCRVYNNKRALIADGDKQAEVATLRIAYRLGEDITRDDRITSIKDRNGTELYSQTYEIKQLTRMRDHFQGDLKEVE